MATVSVDGCDLYYEETGDGVPILLIHPSGATASTWGPAVEELARFGRVITYDRRGYARSGGPPVRSVPRHTEDAAALVERRGAGRAVVFGMSSGATIAVDLAVRRPDLVLAVVEHEAPWRMTRHVPPIPQVPALARIGWLTLRGRRSDAADLLLRSAYAYRNGGSAWDAFPEEWRRAGRENARATLTDFVISIGNYPTPAALATVRVPVVCSYGALSPDFIVRYTRSLAAAIPGGETRRIDGSAHAAPFDATENFVKLIADVARQEVHGDTFGGGMEGGRQAVRGLGPAPERSPRGGELRRER